MTVINLIEDHDLDVHHEFLENEASPAEVTKKVKEALSQYDEIKFLPSFHFLDEKLDALDIMEVINRLNLEAEPDTFIRAYRI